MPKPTERPKKVAAQPDQILRCSREGEVLQCNCVSAQQRL